MNFITFLLCSVLVVNLNLVQAAYVYYPEVGLYYKFYRTPLLWYDARQKCAEENASLAMPRNQNETNILINIFNGYPNSFLIGVTYPDYILLGFHDIFEENEFIALNGEPLQYYYDKWMPTAPNDVNEDCGSLNRQGFLNDFPCTVPSTFICQKNGDAHIRHTKSLKYDTEYKCPENLKKCYKVHKTPKKWTDARMMCVLEGGNLAIIRNRAEEEFMVKLFKENRIHYVTYPNNILIGFHDIFREGYFTTVLDEKLDEIGYMNWTPEGPNGGFGENCGSMLENGKLNDYPCGIPAAFICERLSTWTNVCNH